MDDRPVPQMTITPEGGGTSREIGKEDWGDAADGTLRRKLSSSSVSSTGSSALDSEGSSDGERESKGIVTLEQVVVDTVESVSAREIPMQGVKKMDAEHQAVAETYEQVFDPAEYLRYNYSYPRSDFTSEDNFSVWMLKTLHKAFTEGDIKGGLLLDIGSGPTIYQAMAACEIFDKVIMSDYLEVNRSELENWFQNNGKCSLDWSPFFQYACKLEGRESTAWEDKAARLRKVVKGIVHVDVHLPQPVSPDVVPPEGADCVISCFCLDAACLNMSIYSQDMGHLVSLLKPGGHFLIMGTLGMTYYYGGPKANLPSYPITVAEVCQQLSENGLSLIRLEIYPLPKKMETTDDARAIFFAKAKKI